MSKTSEDEYFSLALQAFIKDYAPSFVFGFRSFFKISNGTFCYEFLVMEQLQTIKFIKKYKYKVSMVPARVIVIVKLCRF